MQRIFSYARNKEIFKTGSLFLKNSCLVLLKLDFVKYKLIVKYYFT